MKVLPTRQRPGVLSDAEVITDYHHRCWIEAFAPLVDSEAVHRLDPLAKLDRWRSWLSEDSSPQTIVADLDGRPVAHVTVDGSVLVHLFVDPDHWGAGLGRELLEVGEDLLAAAGHSRIELTTLIGNKPALALYQSAGWTVTDEVVHNDANGIVYDEHLLIKIL